jgi:large subunit ribosomal protein L4e
MTKTKLFDKSGKEKETIDLPSNFKERIREDILARVYETIKSAYMQPFGTMYGAGAFYSASGISKKRRHAWKGTYGKGISRIPRKIMSRHGSSFNWVGATAPNTRGGRRAHPFKPEKNLFKKVNKKELNIAFNSGFAATIDQKSIEKKYGKKIASGFVFEDKILTTKTSEFIKTLEKLFGESLNKVLKTKKVRAGIGKMRGRKYKSNAGLLFVIGSSENIKRKGIDVVKVNELKIMDLSPNGAPGRLTCYTQNAIKEIGERFN